MNKTDLTRLLARVTHSSQAQAADYLDLAVHSILKRTKRGEKVTWPGLGVFANEAQIRFSKRRPGRASKSK
jgi:nucleoid DNA-binding protein